MRKPLLILLCLILAGIFFSYGNTLKKNIEVRKQINLFLKRSEEYSQQFYDTDINGTTIKYTTVSRETKEKKDKRSVFYDFEKSLLGNTGDILVTRDSPFPQHKLLHEFISFYFGGHAALVNEGFVYEATGMTNQEGAILSSIFHNPDKEHNIDTSVSKKKNYWLRDDVRSKNDPSYKFYGPFYRPEFILLRVKSETEARIEGAVNFVKRTYEGNRLYNYLFFIDTKNKFYCTDLISRAYQAAFDNEFSVSFPKVLNDRFITSVDDIILSEDTYIVAHVIINEGVVEITYIEDQ